MREIEDDSIFDELMFGETEEDDQELPEWLEDDDIIGEIEDDDLEDFEALLGLDDYEEWN